MARKSRMQSSVSSEDKKMLPKVYKAAIYVRLSREKDETRQRGTIYNQRNLIKNYVEQQDDMKIVDIYMDDNISGTRFDRPEFERMMADMRAGKINCIVVKDLSRLGRDYIETGNLIERVFPMLHIRFVAIADHFDSAKAEADLMIPVTNIANALYAQDISKKIYSGKHEDMEKGIPLSRVAYGYKVIHNEDKVRTMVEDEKAAAVVRRIFSEAEANVPTREIVRSLNHDGILTPSQYRARNNPEQLEKLADVKWTCDMISSLLKNAVYIGTYITGRERQCLYKHEKRHLTDKSEWNVFENHHSPLVTVTQFYAAQATRKSGKSGRKHTQNMLRGKILCACCGSRIHIHPERYADVYLCTHRKRYGKDSCKCLPVKVDDVYSAVFAIIKEQIQMLLDEETVAREYNKSMKAQSRKGVYTDALDKRNRELLCVQELKSGLYADYTEELINESEYMHLNKEYSQRMEKLRKEIEEYADAVNRYDNTPLDNSELKEAIHKFRNKRKLSQEMVDAMVSKVLIHEGKNIEIVLNFEDEFKKTAQWKKEREAGML